MPQATTQTPARLEIVMDCKLEAIRSAMQSVKDFLAQQGCSELDVMDSQLALTEACNNAVQYVRPEDRDTPVHIEVSCEPVWIEMRVTDHTAGMNWPRDVPLPSATQEGGRGLYIIKSVMNETRYVPSKSGNTFILRRNRLTPPCPDDCAQNEGAG